MSADYIVDKILNTLNESQSPFSSLDLASQLDVDHQKIVGAIKSISALAASIDSFIDIEQKELKTFQLSEEGRLIVDNGSHEARIFEEASRHREQGVSQSALLACIPDQAMAKVGFSKAMKNGWIKIDKSQNKIYPTTEQIQDQARDDLKRVILSPDALSDNTIKEYKKRKLLVDNNIKYLVIKRGSGFTMELERPETDLTTDLLLSGDWKDRKFKEYNFNALGMPVERGHLHPLLKVREQFRQIFLEMGFSEMPTNNFVESSFWNFDTLIVPQAHPARDSQDTFFISEPEYSREVEDRELVGRVRFAHQGTADGSWPTGYRYNWKEDESSKNVLRTHTTAVTARMLYKLAQEYEQSKQSESKPAKFKPAKLFSIDRVFRNETLDATHLAEFNQVEGVVVDEGLSLGDLMGVLEAFFKKLGIGQLRFKPAYNPYTEPSMEVFSYHEGLKKWVEVGNSGLFRPEMLEALGLPENVSAIAWGLSLERPTMIKYKIDNIRELVGHKVNLEMVQANPLCLF